MFTMLGSGLVTPVPDVHSLCNPFKDIFVHGKMDLVDLVPITVSDNELAEFFQINVGSVKL
jgi:hypothetical protein